MKRNAIARIIIYSLTVVLLLGLLLAGMGKGRFVFSIGSGGGEPVYGSGSVSAAEISALKIDWASGSITIQTGDSDKITFTESGNFDEGQAMTYSVKNGVLRLSYAKSGFQIGFVSSPSKDLTITVPKDWVCRDLELDGASLEVEMEGVNIETLDIDGASCGVTVRGAVEILECDGASCDLKLLCADRPREMELDGASCTLELTLPAGCGFELEMDGLDCKFHSDLEFTHRGDAYRYGDGYCQINADGVSCEVTIRQGE